jgi:broad specificity phosphatase PhoE
MLYLIRHAQPLSEHLTPDSRLPSDSDNVLTEFGVAQANRLAAEFAKIDSVRIFCSPLARSVQTARPVAAALSLEIVFDDRLAERDHASAGALTVQEWREIQDRNYADPSTSLFGEETLVSQRNRVQSWFRDTEPCIRASLDQNLIVVCHGGTIEHLLSCIMGAAAENMVRYFFACDCASICAIEPMLAEDNRLVYRINAINSTKC